MKFDIEALSAKLNKIDKELKEIDAEEQRKKYGTFLDSKGEMAQLYMLFIFFGLHSDIIQQFPVTEGYDPD